LFCQRQTINVEVLNLKYFKRCLAVMNFVLYIIKLKYFDLEFFKQFVQHLRVLMVKLYTFKNWRKIFIDCDLHVVNLNF